MQHILDTDPLQNKTITPINNYTTSHSHTTPPLQDHTTHPTIRNTWNNPQNTWNSRIYSSTINHGCHILICLSRIQWTWSRYSNQWIYRLTSSHMTLILSNHTIYHDISGPLFINNVLMCFQDIDQNPPVVFRIIRALWLEQYDELTKKWMLNKRLFYQRHHLEHNNYQQIHQKEASNMKMDLDNIM